MRAIFFFVGAPDGDVCDRVMDAVRRMADGDFVMLGLNGAVAEFDVEPTVEGLRGIIDRLDAAVPETKACDLMLTPMSQAFISRSDKETKDAIDDMARKAGWRPKRRGGS